MLRMLRKFNVFRFTGLLWIIISAKGEDDEDIDLIVSVI